MPIVHILEALLAFCFMVAIHEWGHFMACRLVGVGVDEYCIGFPPRVFSRKFGKTVYSIGIVPLGGFCKPQGGDLSGQSAEEINAAPPKAGDYLAAAWWKRVLILLAGPAMNFISAFAIMTLVYLTIGEPYFDQKAILGFVPPGSLAQKAGLERGDLVLKVDDKAIVNFRDIDDLLPSAGKSCTITVERGGQDLALKFDNPPKSTDPKAVPPDFGINNVMPTVIGEALMGQPARNAGVQDGDTVISINGKKPGDWAELSYLIKNETQDPLDLEISRNDKTYKISVRRIFTGDYMAIGISPKFEEEKYKMVSFLDAVKDGVNSVSVQCMAIVKSLGNLIIAKVSLKDSVSGPITIIRMMYHQAGQKMEDFLTLVSSISLMLFLMNLLPIPLVDGGQIVLCFIEGVKRHPVSLRIQAVYQQVGIFLILALFALAFFNDFKNLFLEVHNHIH